METKEAKLEDLESKKEEYSEESFWDKVVNFAKEAGCSTVYAALILYYTLDDGNIPTQTKMIIYGALGYFISPLDFIPDITPFVGYTDDFGALALALFAVSTYITDDIKKKAKAKLKGWFDNGCTMEDIEKVESKLKGE